MPVPSVLFCERKTALGVVVTGLSWDGSLEMTRTVPILDLLQAYLPGSELIRMAREEMRLLIEDAVASRERGHAR